MVSGLMAERFGGVGSVQPRRSAEPDLDVEARLPSLATNRREDARMEAVVETLNVE